MLQKSPMYSYIPAQDVARARQFYEQKVGLKPKDEIAGGVVEDIEREVAELKARGVRFEDYDMPNMKTENGIATAGTMALTQSLSA